MRDPKAIHRHNFSSQPHSSPSSHFVHAKHKSRRYSCLDRRRHHTPPLRSPDGRKERSTVGSGAADADGRTDERRHEGSADGRGRNERARLCRRERCGSHGLISHLGVTRGRGAVPPLKRTGRSLFSLPLSFPISPSLSPSLTLPAETNG